MAGTVVKRVRQDSPTVRLFISDGSERSDYLPQREAIRLLGAPHSGVNLMSCYYPRQSFWPERWLFGPDVPHYRHSLCDATEATPLKDPNDWTDGYYSFDIEDPRNDVLKQIVDVRRYGQEVRLSMMADIDTPTEELERIADILKDFGRMQLRLNHEANGNTWFRFARNVGALKGKKQRKLYYDISQFFVRAHHVFRDIAPNVTFVACYNGMGERVSKGEIGPGEMPLMSRDRLGLMYLLPDIVISFDQYGSLHYGWPSHAIEDPPIIGGCDPAVDQAFDLTPRELCEEIITFFRQTLCRLRQEDIRVDLGEVNFDEDIHGPDIQAYLIHETYSWIRRHPEIIGSATFYELTDMGGLALFRQKAYGNVKDLTTTVLLDVYKDIMGWDEFRHPCTAVADVEEGTESIELTWRSSVDAEGLEVRPEGAPAKAIDFREEYWRRVLMTGEDGKEAYFHTKARTLRLRRGTESIRVFALPPDGKDNSRSGYKATVPVPVLV